MSLIPSNTVYSEVMGAYLGNLSISQQNSLWEQFMTQNGFTTNPAATPQDEALFVQFVISTLSTNENSVIDSLSPDEVQRRELFSNVFGLLVQLMNIIQQNCEAEANNLIFYGDYQQNYTAMISQVPIYVVGAPSTSDVDTSNLSDWTLGYDQISMQEVLQSVIAQGLATPAGYTFNLSLGSSTSSSQNYFSFESNPNGLSVDFYGNNNLIGSVNVGYSGETSADQLAAASQAFLSVYTSAPVQPYVEASDMNIPWSTAYMFTYSGSDPSQQAQSTAAYQERATNNSRNQQFIENLTSYRTILGNQADNVQTTLTSSQQGVSSAGNIVQSSLQMLSSICAGIFKTSPI